MTTQNSTSRSASIGVELEERRVSRLVPVALLVAAGALTGLSTDLAKVAFDANISPYAFLTWSVVGGAVVLSGRDVVRGGTPALDRSTSRYLGVAAVLTVVLPRLLMFSAVPEVGVSFVAVSIAFPPLYTYVFALVLRLEAFDIRRAAGVALALVGSLIIALLKLSEPDASAVWVVIALAAPVFLALGNIYRTLRWPPGLAPDELAPGMVRVAALLLVAVATLPGFSLDVPRNGSAVSLIAVHAVIISALYLVMFELQRRGGPVLLSLMGSIAAIVGSAVAFAFLDEAMPGGLFPGGLAIAAGIGLVSKQPRHQLVHARHRRRTVAGHGMSAGHRRGNTLNKGESS